MNWHDIFFFDGDNLLWANKKAKRVEIGGVAGGINSCGYMRVQVDNKYHYNHRIIWEMHHGKIPDGMQIDHINHNRLDNRIDNLRIVSHIDNGRNRSINLNNSSKITGVHWDSRNNKWQARISVDGKRISLGHFSSLFDASCARKSAEIVFNYHQNHGRRTN